MKKLLLLASISLASLNCMDLSKIVTSPKGQNRKATIKRLSEISDVALEMLAKKYELASAIFHSEKYYFEKSDLDMKTGQRIKKTEETSKFIEVKLVNKNEEAYILTLDVPQAIDKQLFLKNKDSKKLVLLINSSTNNSSIKLLQNNLSGCWYRFTDEIQAIHVLQKFNRANLQN